MLKIAICDDEAYFRKLVKNYITDYLSKRDVLFEIVEFGSGGNCFNVGLRLCSTRSYFWISICRK